MKIAFKETWHEVVPNHLPHVTEWMLKHEPAFMTDDFSETYRGDIATQVIFDNGWGYCTNLVVTPDYWRWSISVFSSDGYHFNEASSFEHAEKIISNHIDSF